MNVKIISRMLLLGTVISSGAMARAQSQPATTSHTDIDASITYVAERSKIASVSCGCFWLQGGSGDVGFTFYHGLGVALNLTGVHASNIQSSGLELDTVMFAVGPRYTYRLDKSQHHYAGKEGMALFGEGLFGGKHGFNGVFPSPTGVKGADSSIAFQAGGGVDIGITKTIAIRAVEADYVRSGLANNASGLQHDLRLAAGITFHFRR
jgi:hypothetical protein